jgi:glycosyltransferase involved in cell wall biosynthesis
VPHFWGLPSQGLVATRVPVSEHVVEGTVPGLSVIIPAHDAEPTIRSAMRSAEEAVAFHRGRPGRAHDPAEVVVVDDGSRDGTIAAIIDAARGKDAFRVFHRSASSSPGTARNSGASLASGDLLFFLDADDLFLEHHLSECCNAFDDPAVDWVKTQTALSDPVHADWRGRIGNSLVINLAVRRACHQFIGGFPNLHLFRRSGDSFEAWMDIFRLIEDVHYNTILGRLFTKVEVAAETVRYMRRPGNSFDRQYEKFQFAPGAFREPADPEFDFRVRMSKMIVEYECERLKRRLADTGRPGSPAGT